MPADQAPPPPPLSVAAPASAVGLPRALRAACAGPCTLAARLEAPASAITLVETGRRGPVLLASVRTALLDPAAGARPVRLVPTAAGRRLVGVAAPGRLTATLTVTAGDGAATTATWTGTVRMGPARPWRTTLGRSALGRPLMALLPDGPATTLVTGGMHGDETAAAAALARAVAGAGGGLRAAVMPVVNPDGLARRTRRNARGVDLNRNLPAADWGRGAVAPGRAPASEPETRALLVLLRRLAPARLVSVHAPLGMVEGAAGDPLARALAARTGLPLRASVGYPTPGSLGTWAGERGVRSVTVELRRGAPPPRLVRALGDVLTGRLAPG